MYFAIVGRRQGKTELVLNWLIEDPANRYIIVVDEDRKRHLIDRLLLWKEPQLSRNQWAKQIITAARYSEAFRGRLRGRELAVAIDDLDALLCQMYGPVDLVTGTGTLVAPHESVRKEA